MLTENKIISAYPDGVDIYAWFIPCACGFCCLYGSACLSSENIQSKVPVLIWTGSKVPSAEYWKQKSTLSFDLTVNAALRHVQSGFPETSCVHRALCDSYIFRTAVPLFRLWLSFVTPLSKDPAKWAPLHSNSPVTTEVPYSLSEVPTSTVWYYHYHSSFI